MERFAHITYDKLIVKETLKATHNGKRKNAKFI